MHLKRFIITIGSLSLLACVSCNRSTTLAHDSNLPGTISDIAVSYRHAGLVEIDVLGFDFKHVWHTLKTNQLLARQSMESYNRHECATKLTGEQLHMFRVWIDQHRIFDASRSFPTRDPHSYGAAFFSSLTVRDGRRSYSVGWDGMSDTRALAPAMSNLFSICENVRGQAGVR